MKCLDEIPWLDIGRPDGILEHHSCLIPRLKPEANITVVPDGTLDKVYLTFPKRGLGCHY
jgi:uncharacterized protein (DUF1786 family)